MNQASSTLAYGLDALDMLVGFFTKDFSEDDWAARSSPELHSAWWILAHLVLSVEQATEAELLPESCRSIFEYGSPREEFQDTWPSVEELKGLLERALEALKSDWQRRSPDQWQAPAVENTINAKTVAEQCMFALQHLTYHAGQLGAIRRLLGKPGLI